MKNLTKTFLGAVGLATMFAGNALADDAAPAPDFSFSGAVALQSDYRFRGISQSDRQIAPQATVNVTGPDGFYAGAWASKTNWGLARPTGGTNNPSLEIDEYFGKHTTILDSDLNVEAYYYSYPDYNVSYGGTPKASYFEAITAVNHVFGPVSLTATWAYSPEFAVGGGTGNYLLGTAAFTVNDWLTISGNIGHQWVQNAKYYAPVAAIGSDGDYTNYDIGATVVYKTFTIDARYVGTDANATVCSFYISTAHACSGGFMGTITFTPAAFPW